MTTAAAALRPSAFLGWRVAALATIAAALSGPGQTAAVSVFVDPMIAALGLTRSELSAAYLIGTLAGAMLLLPVGRRIDRIGARQAMTWIGLGFGIGLVVMSGVQGFIMLAIGFTLIRWLGQGSLQLVSTLAITPWFERRRGVVFGMSTTVTAMLISLTPIVMGVAIGAFGWRIAWILGALAVWLIVVPIARFGIIDRPSDVGQFADGDPAPLEADVPAPQTATAARTRAQAMRQARFWLANLVVAATAMLVTALNFHMISILGEQGLTVTEAAAMFLPQVLGAIAAALLFGYLADRVRAGYLLAATMLLLALSLVLAATLEPGWRVLLYAIVLGSAMGSSRPLVATIMPRWYWLAHIGAIQGVSLFLAVAASATGPVAFSLANDLLGGNAPAAVLFASIPIVVGMAALTIRDPELGARERWS